MTFRNSILAGMTLIREAIQSQNFEAGKTGWQISAEGSAEFNDLTIRQGTQISGTSLYYDGTPAAGNLIASIAAEDGTDEFGNDYYYGFTSYTPQQVINISDGSIYVMPGAVDFDNAGGIRYLRYGDGASSLYIDSGVQGSGRTSASITLKSDSASDPGGMGIFLDSRVLMSGGLYVSGGNITFDEDINVHGAVSAENIQTGTLTQTPTTANEWTDNTVVTFTQPFASVPSVVATACGNGPGPGTTTRLEWQITGVTVNGFNFRHLRGNLTSTQFNWLAVSA